MCFKPNDQHLNKKCEKQNLRDKCVYSKSELRENRNEATIVTFTHNWVKVKIKAANIMKIWQKTVTEKHTS